MVTGRRSQSIGIVKGGTLLICCGWADGHAQVVERLVGMGCDARAADQEGSTAWHAAAQGSEVATMQTLLAEGCDIASTNAAGCTALHFAAYAGKHS